MKNIGILAFSNAGGGGVFQYAQSLIDALINDKENKYVIFCRHSDVRFNDCGLEVRKFDKQNSSFSKKLFILFALTLNIQFPINIFMTKEEKEIYSDIDLFISPAISPYPHYFLNKSFIFTLHDMQEKYYPYFFTLKDRIIRAIFNKSISKKANKIICESNYVKNDIIKFLQVDESKIFVISAPPPKDFINYKFDEKNFDKIKKKYNLPDKYIFYPAQFWFHKNHIRLIEAFNFISKDHGNVHLVLTGSEQNNYKSVINKIKELNLNSKIRHLGFVDYQDLPYLYKMSLMLVMPSLFESVSIPIYEAFALKVPVCCSNITAIPEQVGDAGLIFNPFDINDIAEKILLYLNNENLRKEKAKKGFNRVINFNHSEYFKNLKKLLF